MKHSVTSILFVVLILFKIQVILSYKTQDNVDYHYPNNPSYEEAKRLQVIRNHIAKTINQRRQHQKLKQENEDKKETEVEPLFGRELAGREQKLSPQQLQERIDSLQRQMGQLQNFQGDLPQVNMMDNRLKDLEKTMPEHVTLENNLLTQWAELKNLHNSLMEEYKQYHASVKEFQIQMQILELEMAKLKSSCSNSGSGQAVGTMFIPVSHYSRF